QAPDGDLPGLRVIAQIAKPPARLLGAEGPYDKEGAPERAAAKEEREEAEREIVGPLQVVEQKEQRAALPRALGEGEERLPKRREQPHPRGLRRQIDRRGERLLAGEAPERGLIEGQEPPARAKDPVALLALGVRPPKIDLPAAIRDRLE